MLVLAPTVIQFIPKVLGLGGGGFYVIGDLPQFLFYSATTLLFIIIIGPWSNSHKLPGFFGSIYYQPW